MIEFERTYLAKYLPEDLRNFSSKEIIDIYIPLSDEHPVLRIRKNGNKYEMTKKMPIADGDASHQKEQTINLTENEFNELSKIEGKRVRKIRFDYGYKGKKAEFDVFQDELEGLVLVDVEFETLEEKESFQAPEFCLAEVTYEEFVAGGKICGKKCEDIENDLNRFGYKRIDYK